MNATSTAILDYYFVNNLCPPQKSVSLVEQFQDATEFQWQSMLLEYGQQENIFSEIVNSANYQNSQMQVQESKFHKLNNEKERMLNYIDCLDKKITKKINKIAKINEFISTNSHYQDENLQLEKNIKAIQLSIQALDQKSDQIEKEIERSMSEQANHVEKRRKFIDNNAKILEEQKILENITNKNKKEAEKLLVHVQSLNSFVQHEKQKQCIEFLSTSDILLESQNILCEPEGQTLLYSILNRQSELKKMKKAVQKQNSVNKLKQHQIIQKFNQNEQDKNKFDNSNGSKLHCKSAKPIIFSVKIQDKLKDYYTPEICYYKEQSVSPFTVQNLSQYIEQVSDQNLGKMKILRTIDNTDSGKTHNKRMNIKEYERTLKEDLGQENKSFDLGKLELIKEELFANTNSNGEPTFRGGYEKFEFPVHKRKFESAERIICILAIISFVILSK